jgi:putative aldouronate transport system permease protein
MITSLSTKSKEKLFDALVVAISALILSVTLYPFVYVLSLSVSSPSAVIANKVLLFPVGFSLRSYGLVIQDRSIWTGYYNTVWYTVVGTIFNLVCTVLAAYALSKKRFFASGFIMKMFVITMFFSGGMIPLFLVVVKLGIYNTRWAMVLPSLIGTWNLIICRTFFAELPEELFESARIEGSGEWRIVWRIVLPLSKPILAVLTLFYAIAHWNAFFPALLYLPSARLHPLQIFLRRILILSSPESLESYSTGEEVEGLLVFIQIRYTVVIVTILPIVMLYPFLQKYFVKGMMIGSIKG